MVMFTVREKVWWATTSHLEDHNQMGGNKGVAEDSEKPSSTEGGNII